MFRARLPDKGLRQCFPFLPEKSREAEDGYLWSVGETAAASNAREEVLHDTRERSISERVTYS